MRALADRHGISVHMDGARVMNAAVAQRVPLTTILQHTHTVSVCLSKVGLQTDHSGPDGGTGQVHAALLYRVWVLLWELF